jgi:hypothetical protein
LNHALLVRRVGVVVMLSLTFVAFFWAALPNVDVRPRATGASGGSDLQLFIRTVNDLRKGTPYYEATGQELRAGGYPTRSVFNWRQPAIYLLLSRVPMLFGQLCLTVLAAKLLWDLDKILPREIFALAPMVNTVLGLLVPVAVYFTEAWAGVCIGLSLLAYARNRERSGAVWGVLALFARELAAPYCLLAGCLAVWGRRWSEVRVWAIGMAGYAVYYGAHVSQVLNHIRPDDEAHLSSWIAFGGLRFTAETLKTNGLLLFAPPLVVAAVAVALIVAWWNARLPLHARATLVMYCGLFLVVGLPFNGYWGFLIAPAVSLWLAYAWGGLQALWSPSHLAVSDANAPCAASLTRT